MINENLQEKLVEIAKSCIGKPYMWGGESLEIGFDCSGLIWYTYDQLGISIPRCSYEQFKIGISVSRSDLQPGDLVFFCSESKIILKPNHVGLYIGDNKFIEAPHTNTNIRISELNRIDYCGARRIIENNKIVIDYKQDIKHFLGDVKYTLYQYVCSLNSDNISFRCGTFSYNKISNLNGFKGDSEFGELNLNGEIIQVMLTKELNKKQLVITKYEYNLSEPIHEDDIILEFA